MSKCIVRMLKMFISKDVAVQFTAIKQAKGKKIMKTTNLFSCVEGDIFLLYINKTPCMFLESTYKADIGLYKTS